MKLLITGGCGFLGSNLASHAIKLGYDVYIFDNLRREGSTLNFNWLSEQGNIKFINGDIRIRDDVEKAIQNIIPDAVFHLSGQVAMTTSIENPRLDFEINAMGTFNLLESLKLYAHQATVIYSSTNKVYGDLEIYHYTEEASRYNCIDKPNGFDESTPLEFHSPYGCSKGAADQYMLDYARIFGLKTVVFRHSSMYGGRQFSTFDQGWVGWFCKKALAQKKSQEMYFTISGNGKQVRDVLHADDMISLYFAALEKIDKIRGNAFNIGGGTGNSLSLLELFGFIQSLLDIELKFEKLDPRESDQRVFIADIHKINRMIGWKPKVSYKDGIASMVEWIENSEKNKL